MVSSAGTRCETNRNRVDRGKMKDNFFAGFHQNGRGDGTGDDDLAGFERFAESGEQTGGVADEVEYLLDKFSKPTGAQVFLNTEPRHLLAACLDSLDQ